MRTLTGALLALLVAAPAAAQQTHAHPDPDDAVAGTELPDGWQARTDRDQPLDNVRFETMGNGFHATLGPAAVFYNPEWAESGDYSVSARLTQTRAPRHPEAYGIVLGARDMDTPEQAYSYFLVRKTGDFFIATRRGAERVKVVDWTRHEAIQAEDEQGRQSNVLGAEVRGDEVIFTVNGQEVARRPRSEILTDGIFGFRINHNLDVHVGPITR